MNKPWLRYVIHTGVWILLYFIPYLFFLKGRTDIFTLFRDSGDFIHLLSFILLIAYSYLNYILLIPRLYFQKKYLWYFLSFLVCLFVVIKVPQFFIHHQDHFSEDPNRPFRSGFPGDPPPILFGINYNIILFLVSTFLSLSMQYRSRLFAIEEEKLQAELSFLKAQINPHFLFNTLNSIYSLAIEKSDATPGAIIQLADLMRYVMQDSNSKYVDLNKELTYIDNYIALQKQRLGDTVKISYITQAEGQHLKIAPLLLVSFIENAFKHGVNPDKDSRIEIMIAIEGNTLQLHVSNTKVPATPRLEQFGIGLKNAETRLEHLYPQQHELQINDGQDIFMVNLKIVLA